MDIERATAVESLNEKRGQDCQIYLDLSREELCLFSSFSSFYVNFCSLGVNWITQLIQKNFIHESLNF